MARKRQAPRRSGLLVIDKPAGWTSHDVVGRVRRVVGERQVGHAGTLDPAATGVLPIAVGHATRLLPFAEETDKTYVATVRFGVMTDSGDRDGRLIGRAPVAHLTEDAIQDALHAFRGQIEQTPPMHSAIKVGGRKLYELARSGASADIPVRRVTIHELVLRAWEPPDATMVVTCSAGTYIRSLARDLGEALDSGAMLSRLTRTAAGRFDLRAAIPIGDLEERLERWGWSQIALHPDAMLPNADMVLLTPEEESRWFNGLPIDRQVSTSVVRVYDSRREWVGVGLAEAGQGRIQPKRVVRTRSEQP